MGLHHDHHHHGHDHGHHHHRVDNTRRVTIVLIMTASFMLVEFAYGWMTNSLALMADAAHMLTDAGALGLTLFAFRIARLPPNDQKTFGYYRSEILAAFLNGIILAILAALIVWEAFERFQNPAPVQAREMMTVAVLGLLVNLAAGWILLRGDKENLNLRGALFHVLGDALSSAGTIVAGAAIIYGGYLVADPAASILISALNLFSAWKLVSETTHVFLQGVPKSLDVAKIREELLKVPGVRGIHSLHVWSLSSRMTILTVHIESRTGHDHVEIVRATQKLLRENYHIEHTTVQVEPENSTFEEKRIE